MLRKPNPFCRLFIPALVIAFLALLSACGTGGLTDVAPPTTTGAGTGTGTTPGTGTGTGTPSAAVAQPAGFVDLLVSSPQVGSDGLSTITLTALVKTATNVALKDKTVTFAASTGTLVVTSGTTDASGAATATLSAAPDKSKRTITVTATADSIASTTPVDVAGTTLQITGQNSLISGSSTTLSIFLKDSAGKTIRDKDITLTSSKSNGFDKNPVTTNVNGQADVTYTATNAGTDTVTASALGAIATQTINVSSTDFIFTAPTSGTEINIGALGTVRVRFSGVPPAGQPVVFSTTRGTMTALAITDAGGIASVADLTSTTAGPAIITATTAAAGTIQLPVEFVATTASAMSLQVSPGTISTNTAGSTVEQSTIIAVIRDAAGNLVKNKTVQFSLEDISGGFLKQASDRTNSQGTASTTYISSTSPSVKNGVLIKASVADAPAVTAPATLTVGSKQIYVVLGLGNAVENFSPTQYRVPVAALVTDIAGNPVAGVDVTANLTPVFYSKGQWVSTGCPTVQWWTQVPSLGAAGGRLECVNEDNNPIFFAAHPDWLLNGVLNAEPLPSVVTEDINLDGVLTPGNVAEVNRTATTDQNGFALFNVIYAKQFANWVKVKIEGKIISFGDQTLGTTQFYLPVIRDDVACSTVPPGQISPFGLGDAIPGNNVCTNTN